MDQDNFNQNNQQGWNNQQSPNNNHQNYNNFNNDYKHGSFTGLVYAGVLVMLIGSGLGTLFGFLAIFLELGLLNFNYFGLKGTSLIVYNIFLTLFSLSIFLISLNFFLKKRVIIALLITALIIAVLTAMLIVLIGAILALIGYYTNNRAQETYFSSQTQTFNPQNDQQFPGGDDQNTFVNNNINSNSQEGVKKNNDENNSFEQSPVFVNPSNHRSFKVKNKSKRKPKK